MNKEELIRKLCAAASTVKLCTGVANNAAVLVLFDAYDIISGNRERWKRHPNFRQECKRWYKHAIDECNKYERNLLHTDVNRFFSVADMDDHTRSIYDKDMTDEEYFEFWKGMGSHAYKHTMPFITSLCNKYRLSLVQHHIPNAEQLAWGMTATGMLMIAQKIYHASMEQSIRDLDLPRHIVYNVFSAFSMKRVLDSWSKAVSLTQVTAYNLEPMEKKNIELGMSQLIEKMINPDMLYDSCISTIPKYDDVFKNKATMKAAIKNIKKVRYETEGAV